METTDNSSLRLADGYTFAEWMASDYRVVYGHIMPWKDPVYVSRIDGSERVEICSERQLHIKLKDDHFIRAYLCFSPDGGTMYMLEDELRSKEIATGQMRVLNSLSSVPYSHWRGNFECSPDGTDLLFTSMLLPPQTTGWALASIYRVGTDGSKFRLLYEDPEEYRLNQIVTCWPHDYALLCRSLPSKPEDNQLWKLDMETGDLTAMRCPAQNFRRMALHPYTAQIAFEHGHHGDYPELSCGAVNGDEARWKSIGPGWGVAWSPDGQTLAYMKDQNCLALLDVASGEVTDLVWFDPPGVAIKERQGSRISKPIWSPDGRFLWFLLTSIPEPVRYERRIYGHDKFDEPIWDYRNGFLDRTTKQVWMRRGGQFGISFGVSWLPG